MDCVDLVVGTARGDLSRIGDYYTRDRSTPLFDHVYGGRDSLTAAMGYEENGETTILFRRKLTAEDEADWTIENGLMHVIWARGQEKGDTVHSPPTSLEQGEISDPGYYRPDELKYHGHADHRGTSSFNFFDADSNDAASGCSQGGCLNANSCPYSLNWTYSATDQSVTFEMSGTVADNEWMAIGFSDTNDMPNTDVIMAWFGQDGKGVVSDRYATGRSVPVADTQQNVEVISSVRLNGVSTFVFKRLVSTGDDAQDVRLNGNGNDASCPFVMYARTGSVDAQGNPGKHVNVPVRVGSRICFGVCSQDDGASTQPPSTTADPEVYIVVPSSIRLTRYEYSEASYGSLDTNVARELKRVVENSMDAALRGIQPNYVKSTVTGFRSGSVIADVDVTVQGQASQATAVRNQVESSMQQVVGTGSLNGAMVVDENYLQVAASPRVESLPPDNGNNNDDDDDDLGEAEIIIIAIAVAFCVVAVVVVAFKLWEANRNKSAGKNRMSNDSGSSTHSSNKKMSDSSPYMDIKTSGAKQMMQTRSSTAYMSEPHQQQMYDNPGYQAPNKNFHTTYIP
ncbi:uncharacterized protein LOC106011832 [Aplysia californica]|uniref:Uncharacterized protein LOC106011832 n=1 Tax=Aplysia californica TaxID=6500 RepID=A0ABM1A0F5_APLCA|nr:uncharacterized protein LOC106011832 [Aplysia californica]